MEYFFIPISEIIDNKYDLSFNRYNTTICEEEDFAPPKEILEKMTLLESEIKKDLDELEGMLK